MDFGEDLAFTLATVCVDVQGFSHTPVEIEENIHSLLFHSFGACLILVFKHYTVKMPCEVTVSITGTFDYSIWK